MRIMSWEHLESERQYLGAQHEVGFQENAIMAEQFAERTLGAEHEQSTKEVRTLISAVTGGHPIVMTWGRTVQDYSKSGIEIVKTTVVPVLLQAPAKPKAGKYGHAQGLPGMVRVKYWGFEHWVYMNQVMSINTPTMDLDIVWDED